MKYVWKPIDALINYLEKYQGVTVGTGLGLLAALTLLRTFFENYSNPEPFGGFTSWFILLGFFLYYAGVMLLMTALLSFILKKKSMFVYGALILTSPVILTAPLFDLALSGGRGYCMSYLGDHGWFLVKDFFTYFGPMASCGITPGIRIEIVLVLIGIGFFVYRLTRSFWKTAFGVFGTYVILFANLAASGIIVTISEGFGKVNASAFFGTLLQNSLIPSIHTYVQTSNIYYENYVAGAIFMGRFSWVICLVALAIVGYQQNKPAFKAFIRDFRIARVLYYSFLALFGMRIAYQIGLYAFIPHTFADILGYIIFFAVIALNFTFAAVTNDIVDMPIDAISNKHRPLVQGALTVEQYKSIALLLGVLIISGSLLINYTVFICTLLFHICFYLYSIPPLRLKRHFLPGGILLALAGLITMMSGYGFFSLSSAFHSFPLKLSIFILIFLFIVVHIRDFKDIEGDAKEGIQTLPVVLGEKKARILLGVLILIGGIITGSYLYKYFEIFSLAVYALSATFFISMIAHKVDERISFILVYILAILALIFF